MIYIVYGIISVSGHFRLKKLDNLEILPRRGPTGFAPVLTAMCRAEGKIHLGVMSAVKAQMNELKKIPEDKAASSPAPAGMPLSGNVPFTLENASGINSTADGPGNSLISFWDSGKKSVMYAAGRSGSFELEYVCAAPEPVDTSICTDPSGIPYIIFNSGMEIVVAVKNGDSWAKSFV